MAAGNDRRDLTIVLTASSAIFAALVGTNALDIGSSSHWMGWIDHAAIVLWIPALLLLALCAYLGPGESHQDLRFAAGVVTAIAAGVTAGVLLASGFNITRDHDKVRLVLSGGAVSALRSLCGANVRPDHIDGHIRASTLQQEFVIFDFENSLGTSCSHHSVQIPRGAVLGIREDPTPYP